MKLRIIAKDYNRGIMNKKIKDEKDLEEVFEDLRRKYG